jgi:VWFA-related protein
MRATLVFAVILAGTALVPGMAADDPVTFRSDVSLVRVDVQVLDRDNRAITGLQLEDFLLSENGQPRQIRNFVSENMPVDVLFLLDVSASMRPHVQRISTAAHQALRVLGDKDRVGIMVFDRATRVRLPFRNSRLDVEHEFEDLLKHETFRGGTDITRGMMDAAEYIGRHGRPDARRAIVILTDDQTEFERNDEGVGRALDRADTVMSALIAPDAMGNMSRSGPGGYPSHGGHRGGMGGGIYIPGMPGGGGYPGGGGGSRYPQGGGGSRTHTAGTSEIAEQSGGDSFRVDEASALETTLTRLRQRYALYFQLPEGSQSGQARNINVALSQGADRRYPSADLRYRRAYKSPADAGSVSDNSTSDDRPHLKRSDPDAVSASGSSPNARVSNDDGSSGSYSGDKPETKRRPAVSGPSGGSSGPIVVPNPQP